jgi:DNA-binding PucR family transcriptional regulator
LLFSVKNRTILENYFTEVLGAISSSDNKDNNLIEILETYLNENCNITATAEKLFLHRNTLKYKIKKIEELLNCDLHNFNDCIKVKIALYVNTVLKK